MNFISATEEQKQKSPEEEKTQPWFPPPQHNFLNNWQRHLALRKRQQEALSGEQVYGAPTLPYLTSRLCCCLFSLPPVQSLDLG